MTPRPPTAALLLLQDARNYLTREQKILNPVARLLLHTSTTTNISLGPIGDALRKAGLPRVSSRKGAAHGLVTDPELCDETLKLLAPSLERYKGCNIIDINPGQGLWSTKVHDLLKPRSHLLVEPNKKIFYPMWEPLLTKPGSTYRFLHRHLNMTSLKHQSDEAEEFLSYPLEPRQGSDKGLNENTLILATMTTMPITSGRSRVGFTPHSPSEPFLYSYLVSLLERTGFHSRGLVRMLIWIPETEKYLILPRAVNGRSSHRPRLEDVAHITEVVGSAVTAHNKRRSRDEICSAIHTAQKMREAGLTFPQSRASPLHQAVLESFDDTITEENSGLSYLTVDGHPLPRASSLVRKIEQLEALEKRFAEKQFVKSTKNEADKRVVIVTPEYTQMTTLAAELEELVPSTKKSWSNSNIDTLIIEEEALVRLERTATDPSISERERTSATEQANALAAKLSAARSRLTEREARALATTVDNTLALRNSPALMACDRRPFEPLFAKRTSFYPSVNLALLDINPDARQASEGDDFRFLAAHLLVQTFRAFKLATITEALGRTWYGAAEAILTPEKCPTLFDPQKGGRLHVENMRVRMLTPGMLIELCAAWDEWPFRATDDQLRQLFRFEK